MADHGCTILLNHNQIEAFYESVRNPDIEELSRRDRFLRKLKERPHFTSKGRTLYPPYPILILMP